MSPAAYFDIVVLPTVREFLDARGDRRLAYLACISAYHLCDYVARTDGITKHEARAPIKVACRSAFEVVEGICNGSKHCGRDGRGAFDHEPGTERAVMAFACDTEHAGFDEGRADHAGLEIEHDGSTFFIDDCLLDFLHAAAAAYPTHLPAAASI